MRPSRLLAPLAALTAVALATPALAATAPPATEATERVLLTLTPHDRGALHALARGRAPSRSARVAALHRALPTPGQRQSVAQIATSLGLTVDHVDTMSVLVTGPATRVDALFGSARAVAPRSPIQHALPTIPAALRGRVTAAFGGDDSRPAFRHFLLPTGTVDGTDLRTAYGDDGADPLTLPADPQAAAATRTETIATVQLSGWHASDLDSYAGYLRGQTGDPSWPAPHYKGIDDPLLPAKVATSDRSPNFGNDVEVALDQEAIYSVAPYARQRAYLSGNDLLGMYDSLSAIGDDATDPTIDHHIVAASISWGFCESDLAHDPNAADTYRTFDDLLSYVVGSGVTVFAASGDNGTTCDPGDPSRPVLYPPVKGVSYPASSPYVVAVGGTQSPAGTVTDPSDDTAWSDDHGASGGGVSRAEQQPAYQAAAGAGATCPVNNSPGRCRTVPDIAAMAGAPYFSVWTSSAAVDRRDNPLPVAGTSLASPVAAAGYAVQVAAHGYSWGVGNILPGLYRQAAAFTDIAPAGYDQATGLGAPHWATLVSAELGGDPHLSVPNPYSRTRTVAVQARVPDWQDYSRYRVEVDADHQPGDPCLLSSSDSPTPPASVRVPRPGAQGIHQLTLVAISAPAADGTFTCHYADAFVLVDSSRPRPRPRLTAVHHGHRVAAHWSSVDGSGSGVASYQVVVSSDGHRLFADHRTRPGTVTVPAYPGRTYTLTVTATDRAGNSRTGSAQLVDDKAFGFRGAWSRTRTRSALARSQAWSQRVGAKARTRATGATYTLYVTTCARCGRAAVFVDGRRRATVDTYTAHTHHLSPVRVYTGAADRSRSVVVKVLKGVNRHSRGRRVYVDGVATRV